MIIASCIFPAVRALIAAAAMLVIAAAGYVFLASERSRAIRYGVRSNGEGFQIMPSPMYYHFSDVYLGRNGERP